MELHRADLALVPLARQREGEPLCQLRLTGPGRSLKDDVLLVAKAIKDAFKLYLLKKAAVSKDVVNCVRNDWGHRMVIVVWRRGLSPDVGGL